MKPKYKRAKRDNDYTLQIWYTDRTSGAPSRVNWKNCRLETVADEIYIIRAIKKRYPTATAANVYAGITQLFQRQIKIQP